MVYKKNVYLQRHTLLPKSGIQYVVLGNGLHPQQDHDERGEEVDIKQSSVKQLIEAETTQYQ